MQRILVTGASGFVGGHLIQVLRSAGHVTVGLCYRSKNVGLQSCDLTNPDEVEGVLDAVDPDVVIHCAAISTVTMASTLEYYRINLVATENILRACASSRKRVRFLFMSSGGVYGNHNRDVLDESLAPAPTHHYGLSKFASEQMILNGPAELDFTILRPFNIVGPGQVDSFIVPKLAAAFGRGHRKVRLGNIDVHRDFIEVGAVCRAIAALLPCKESFGQVVNVCTGRGTSLRFLIETLQKLTGYQIEIEQAVDLARKGEVWRMIGSNAKLEKLIGRKLECAAIESVLQDMLSEYTPRRQAS